MVSETEGERDADEANAETGVGVAVEELRGEDRAAAASEDEPEGAEGLGTEAVGELGGPYE